MAETDQSKINFTNLSETYLYGKISDRSNFYKYYQNDENSIDDPIFTGFTFDIDILHSPLFFTGTGDSYISTDILRDTTGSGNTDLATTIENRLQNVYNMYIAQNANGYGLSALSAKDLIDNAEKYRGGYGLQEDVFADEILYGATDYIYMVDKVTSSNDDTTNIGSGSGDTETTTTNDNTDTTTTPDTGITAIANVVMPDVEVTAQKKENKLLTVKLKEVNENLNNTSDEHNTNLSNVDKSKATYEDKLNEKDSDYGWTYQEMIDKISSTKTEIEREKKDVQEELAVYQSLAKENLIRVKTNFTDTGSISNLETNNGNFQVFCKDVESGTYWQYITINFVKATDFSKEISEMTDEESKSGLLETFKLAWEVIDSYIENVEVNNAATTGLKNLQNKINNIEKELYGTDDNGNPLTEATASSDSLYGKYKEAKETSITDSYTNYLYQKDSLVYMDSLTNSYTGNESAITSIDDDSDDEDIDLDVTGSETSTDTDDSEESSSSSTDTEESIIQTPTTDNINNTIYDQDAKTNYNKRLTRGSTQYEVPQTVYDILGFISGMKKLTQKYPYIMQTVSGLDEAYKKYFVVKDPYLGSGDDKITITCYDSLDLRVSSMFNKYHNAIYDRQYRRERVPVNLRRFNCSVFVHDIRNFRSALSDNFSEYKDGDDPKSKIVEIALNYASAIEFKFYDCEIVPEETGSIFDSVSNASAGDAKQTNFTFTYGNCVINFLPFEDLKKYYSSSNKNELKTSKSDLNDLQSGDIVYEEKLSYIKPDDNTTYMTSLAESFTENNYLETQYEYATSKMEDALGRIMSGISASTGIPVPGINDVFNIGHINNIERRSSGIAKELGNVYNNNESTNTLNEIGNLNDNVESTGISTEIGDVVSDVESTGTSAEIGDLNDNVESTGTSTEIGDVVSDVESTGIITDIGNLNTDIESTDITKEIGNVNTSIRSIEVTKEIGNLNGNIESIGISTGIGDVVSDVESTGISAEIGDLNDNIESKGTSTEIGNLNDNIKSIDISAKIGNIDGDVNIKGTSTEIGDVDNNIKSTGTSTEIGDVDNNIKSTGTSTVIGSVYNDEMNSIDISTNIGSVYNDEIVHQNTSKNIGNVYGNNINNSGTSTEIGSVNEKNKGELTILKKIGSIYDEDIKSRTITDIGNIYNNVKESDEINDLGNINMEDDKPKDVIKKIGKNE